MVDVRLLLKFIDRASVTKTLFRFLLIALFPIIDIWLLIFLSSLIPTHYNLLLAILLTLGLTGFFIIFLIIRRELNEIQFMIKNGIFPEKQFYKLAGSFLITWFLISPGILSSLAGFFFLIPALKTIVGKAITKNIHKDIKDVYEYIKLYEIEI